jgi:hypothetical protein
MVSLHENDRVVMDDPSADKQGSASCFRGGKVKRPITPPSRPTVQLDFGRPSSIVSLVCPSEAWLALLATLNAG